MGNIFFTLNKQIEMFIFDYLNNLSFRNKNFKEKYLAPLINHFDYFHKIILKILKETRDKQEINLVCSGLYILARNINFILNNELESQLVEIIKNLDTNKKSILISLILFSGVVLSETNTFELIHKCNLGKFKNNFKKALKGLKIDDWIITINNWPTFYFSWRYIFRISNDNLSQDPKNWFLSLIR